MKTIKQRDDETMMLSDAVKLLMAVKGCSAQIALEELIRAHLKGDIPITAQFIRKEKDDCSD